MSRRQRPRDRNASVTLEFILVLPFLVVTLFAVAQFSVALVVRQAITHAAIAAAREAGKGEDIENSAGPDRADVVRVVDNVLEGAHGIDVSDLNGGLETAIANSGVKIILEVGQEAGETRPAQAAFSDPSFACTCGPPAAPALQVDEVRATVCFEMRRHPICNWLFSFSDDYVSFGNRVLSASALVKKENAQP